jgi:hypothetical protein
MNRFRVSGRSGQQMVVDAPNWIAALGDALERMGILADLDRLACEVMRSGAVVARDARTGLSVVVQRMGEAGSVDGGEDAAYMYARVGRDVLPSSLFSSGESPEAEEERTDSGEEVPHDPAVAGLMQRLARVMAGVVQRAPSPEVAWSHALELALQLVPAEAGSAMRRESGGGLRVVDAQGTVGPALVGMVLPAGTGLVGYCVECRASLLVRNVERDPRFYRGVDQITGFITRSVLCSPVLVDGQAVGALQLVNPAGDRLFTRVHMDQLELVAATLAARLSAERVAG